MRLNVVGRVRAVLLLIAAMLAGCVSMPPLHWPKTSNAASHQTFLMHLPGIAGNTPFDRWWVNELREGGAADQVELYDWTCHDPGIAALRARGRNHREAQKVADRIAAQLRKDPHARMIITSQSGGCAVAVWALERLPEDVEVDSVVLTAPALSPEYDLTEALRHVRGKMYAFNSRGDVVVLGAGTRVYGTMDGVKTDAAGRIGFHRPASATPDQYRKLVQMPWKIDWIQYFNFGDHTGAMSPAFARRFLAPLLIAQTEEPARSERVPRATAAPLPPAG